MVPVVPPLHIGIVLGIRGNAGNIEQKASLLGFLCNPSCIEGVLDVLVQGPEEIGDPLGAEGGPVEPAGIKPVLGIADGFALTSTMGQKLLCSRSAQTIMLPIPCPFVPFSIRYSNLPRYIKRSTLMQSHLGSRSMETRSFDEPILSTMLTNNDSR